MVPERNRTGPVMSKPPAAPAMPNPFHVVRLAEVDSTSDEAARRLRAGGAGTLPLPAVVVADVQTSGRGTRGRTWRSSDAHGSLTATFALPIHPTRPVQHLPLLAGLCVRDALAEFAGDDRLTIKWPNDVMLDGRKLAGLLCERRDGADLIGVGVNLSSASIGEANDPAAKAASPPTGDGRHELVGRVAWLGEAVSTSRDAILAAVARRFAADLLPASATLVGRLDALRRHDFLRGREVELDTPAGRVAGRCDGIASDGRLSVVEHGAFRLIASGTVVRIGSVP